MKKINCIEDIAEFAGKVIFAEIGWNPFLSGVQRIWDRLECFSTGSYGYPTTHAVSKEGVHSRGSITDYTIERGDVFIRLAMKEEVAESIPSYGEVWSPTS